MNFQALYPVTIVKWVSATSDSALHDRRSLSANSTVSAFVFSDEIWYPGFHALIIVGFPASPHPVYHFYGSSPDEWLTRLSYIFFLKSYLPHRTFVKIRIHVSAQCPIRAQLRSLAP